MIKSPVLRAFSAVFLFLLSSYFILISFDFIPQPKIIEKFFKNETPEKSAFTDISDTESSVEDNRHITVYNLIGTITSINSNEKKVTITHQDFEDRSNEVTSEVLLGCLPESSELNVNTVSSEGEILDREIISNISIIEEIREGDIFSSECSDSKCSETKDNCRIVRTVAQ